MLQVDLNDATSIPAALVGISTVVDCATARPEESAQKIDWDGKVALIQCAQVATPDTSMQHVADWFEAAQANHVSEVIHHVASPWGPGTPGGRSWSLLQASPVHMTSDNLSPKLRRHRHGMHISSGAS